MTTHIAEYALFETVNIFGKDKDAMIIEKIIEERPHLKESLKLYEKALEFGKLILQTIENPLSPEDTTYPSPLIVPLIENFSLIFDMPGEMLTPLKEALELGHIDFTRLPLNETPSFSLPYHEDELSMLLYLIGKPYFLWSKDICTAETAFWQEGKCPVCVSTPSIALIKDEGERTLYCSYCESLGAWHRIGCPRCLSRDAHKFDIIEVEEEKGMRIDLCNNCLSYVKTKSGGIPEGYSPGLFDIISMPLDVIAQERGYQRRSPNPMGMTKMT